ncbi:MAG: putative toxin-antitoxin system toxin component, PIN family [Lewinellaceae bacterium]|nr:putative toxin-antitoxin system toxin component, PIN family [Lewinellaceae bacterium]
MRIVLDTNVFLVSVLPRHKYWWVFQALLDREYDLLVSTDILTEYLEQCTLRYGLNTTEERLDFLLDLPNVELITPSFHWRLIHADPDDDKFVDCAVAGNSDFIITNDGHFNILKDVPFPKVATLRIDEFQEILVERRKFRT